MFCCASISLHSRIGWLERNVMQGESYKVIAQDLPITRESVRQGVFALIEEKRGELTHLRKFLAA